MLQALLPPITSCYIITDKGLFLDMFYQEALPKFHFLSCVDSLLTIGDRHWRKVAATFKKAESTSVFAVHFSMSAYFCMGAYKHDVVVVIKMGAYTHGVLILCGCLLSRFYGSNIRHRDHCHPGQPYHAHNTCL